MPRQPLLVAKISNIHKLHVEWIVEGIMEDVKHPNCYKLYSICLIFG